MGNHAVFVDVLRAVFGTPVTLNEKSGKFFVDEV